jgi:hypothetical protein
MIPSSVNVPPLQPVTVKHVDWDIVEDVFGALGVLDRADRSSLSLEPLSEERRAAIEKAFEVAIAEFGKTLKWLRATVKFSVLGIIVAVTLAVAGGVLVQVTPWAGVVSLATIGSLFMLIPKTLALARDQAMLELVPARYSLAIGLCATNKDAQMLVSKFLEETSSLRKRGG